MAIRSGLASQLGCVAETTYGTFVTPTRFLEFNEESMELAIERIESAGLRAGNRVLRSDRYAVNKKGAAGSASFEVQTKGFGLLFKHWLGAAAISTPSGATNTRLHTHTLGDPYGLALTWQVGKPGTGGTVHPHTYLGTKIVSGTLSQALDEFLMLELELDAQDETTAQSLASASYASSVENFDFTQCAVTIGGSSVAVKEFTLTVAQGLNAERYFLQSSSLKKEPVAAAFVEITGEITMEFEDLTQYNRYTGGSTHAVVATWTGDVIEGSFNYKITVTLPAVRFDGSTPVVGGPDMLEITLPFKALYNGTDEPITLAMHTTDTAS